jgi:uncharacterized membrane protein
MNDSSDQTSPPDPRASRQRRLVAFLYAAVGVGLVAALVGATPRGEAAALAAVGVAVAAPLVRVAWLVARWVRRGDLRFALAGSYLLVLAVVALVVG